MNFFCTKNHYDQWVEKMAIDKEDIFGLALDEGILVAKKLFSVTDL